MHHLFLGLRGGRVAPPLCGPPPPVAAVRADRGALRGAALSRPGVARGGRRHASAPGMGGRGHWYTELAAVPWALASRLSLTRKSLYWPVGRWWAASWSWRSRSPLRSTGSPTDRSPPPRPSIPR